MTLLSINAFIAAASTLIAFLEWRSTPAGERSRHRLRFVLIGLVAISSGFAVWLSYIESVESSRRFDAVTKEAAAAAEQLQPRKLTETQREILINDLKGAAIATIRILANPADDEAKTYADQFAGVFRAAGCWTERKDGSADGHRAGPTRLSLKFNKQTPPLGAQSLMAALERAGLKFDIVPAENPEILVLRVEAKL